MVHCPSSQELKKALGKEYRIRVIDWEKCLYRDFGNGFNVEVSGCSRANRKGPATLYLWYGDSPGCFIVHTAHDVGRSADAIGTAVEELYDYSQSLLSRGYDTAEKLWNLKTTFKKGRILL